MGFLDKMKDGMAQAQAAASQMPTQMPTQQDMDYMQRVTRINNAGVDMPATITSLSPTGRTDAGGVEYAINVRVEPVTGAPYDAAFTQFMHEQSMGSWATPGAAVNVRVDPEDPQAMLLWGGR